MMRAELAGYRQRSGAITSGSPFEARREALTDRDRNRSDAGIRLAEHQQQIGSPIAPAISAVIPQAVPESARNLRAPPDAIRAKAARPLRARSSVVDGERSRPRSLSI
jgi:hypothetical protein